MINSAGAVELFEEEDVGEVVGGGEGGKGETEVCAGFEGLWEAVGAAQDEGEVIALVFVGFDGCGEFLRGEFRADGVECNDDVAFGDRVVDLCGVGDDFLRHHGELFQAQTKFIPNCGKGAFWQRADGDEGNFQHKGEP